MQSLWPVWKNKNSRYTLLKFRQTEVHYYLGAGMLLFWTIKLTCIVCPNYKKGSIHSIRTSRIIKWRKKLKCTGLKFVGISLLLYPPQTMTGKNGTGNCGNRNFFLEILKAVPTDLTNSRNDGPHLKNVLEWAMKSLLYFITAWNLVGRS